MASWDQIKSQFANAWKDLKDFGKALQHAIIRGSFFSDVMPPQLNARQRRIMAAFFFLMSIPLFFAAIPAYVFKKLVYETFLKDLIQKHPIISLMVLMIPALITLVFYVIPVMIYMMATAAVGGLLSFTAVPVISWICDKAAPKSVAVATIDQFTNSRHHQDVTFAYKTSHRATNTYTSTVSNIELFYVCMALIQEHDFDGNLVDGAVLELLQEALEYITTREYSTEKNAQGQYTKREKHIINGGVTAKVEVNTSATNNSSISIKITNKDNEEIPLTHLTTIQYDQLQNKQKYIDAAKAILAPKPIQEKERVALLQ